MALRVGSPAAPIRFTQGWLACRHKREDAARHTGPRQIEHNQSYSSAKLLYKRSSARKSVGGVDSDATSCNLALSSVG